jgi:predicted neuraminidase
MKKSALTISGIFFFISILVSMSSFGQADELYLNPPQLIRDPAATETHHPQSRHFTGIPSVAITDGGRMWAVWYSGKLPGEDQHNYVVVSASSDAGNTWTEMLAIDPDGDGPVRAFDPEIWVDPVGRLWVFWAQTIGHDGTVAGVWTITTEKPDRKKPKWSEPRRLTDGIMMCKPFVMSTGEWVLPASTWRLTDHSARMVVSTDQGNSWQVRGACQIPEEVRSFDEHIIIERKDGSLWMLVRTKYGIGESASSDRGQSWSPLRPAAIQHPSARFFIRRLASGNLILVKHGPIDVRTDRSQLTAYVSSDDGKTWRGRLMLDERKGVSYPDGQQTKDGSIYIIYDFNRTKEQHILITRFKEQDVLYGLADASPDLPRVVVSDGGGQ